MFDSGSARVHALLLLIIVLLLGVIIGGSAIVFFTLHTSGPDSAAPAAGHKGMLPRLHERIRGSMHPGPHERVFRELNLTDEQRKEVHRILANRRTEMNALLESTHKELRTILTEEQAQQFDTMRPPLPPAAPSAPHPH
jgi:Spy/CpxP family protein refolding chaperone